MGAKLGKNIPVSEKVNGHTKEVKNISTNHIDGTTTLDRKSKKKKEKIIKQKSLDIKEDKFTSTEGTNDPLATTYVKHLVTGYASNSHLSYDAQSFTTNLSDTVNKDILEFRDACIRRGIISPETNCVTLETPIVQDQQEKIPDTIEEPTYGTTVNNDEQVPTEQQQQQIES